jgi:hypothetical protein
VKPTSVGASLELGVSEVGEHGHFRKPSIRVHQFGFIIF